MNKKKILFLILFFLPFSYTLRANNYEKFDSIADVIDKICLTQGTRTRELIEELYQIASTGKDSSILLSKCLYNEAKLNNAQGIVDTTLINRIRHRSDKLPSGSYEYALLTQSLGLHYASTGEYSEAFTSSLEALEKFRIHCDTTHIIKTLRMLGGICININLFGLSKEYYREALNLINSDHNEYMGIRQNLYTVYYYEHDFSTAIDSMESIIEPLKKSRNEELLVANYLNLGAVYFMLEDADKCLYYWEKSQELMNSFDAPKLQGVLYVNFGIYTATWENDYKKTLDYYKRAQQIMEKNELSANLLSLYGNLAHTYELLGNVDSAFFYMKKYKEWDEKFVPNAKAVEAYRKYILNFLEASETKLIVAEQEIELKKKQFIVIIVISISIILFVLFLLILIQQKKREKEHENRELAGRIQHEKKIQELEKEKQQEMIEAKIREITSYSLLLSNKNKILQQILELNTQLRTNGNKKEVTAKIEEIIQGNFNVDEEWEDFKMHFDKVHPSFFDKLKNMRANLTEDNLRICAYFKMGMSTKQISQLLHITPSSVITNRYRLKKKLGLGVDEDFDDFIRNL